MNCVEVMTKQLTKDHVKVYPSFIIRQDSDLITKGGEFVAFWDDKDNTWHRDIHKLILYIDNEVRDMVESVNSDGYVAEPMYLSTYDNQVWHRFRAYLRDLPSDNRVLDDKLTFQNDHPSRNDYSSKSVPYALAPGDYSAWDKLIGTLYAPSEREKLEWAIGSVVAGDSRFIQKFIVLYGSAGSGKSTVLNIIEALFEGYVATIDAKALASNSNAFATEPFKGNPLVAIQHDSDLSRIQDNTKLNSIISHENIIINEKHKSLYAAPSHAFLFLGTNNPVKITDSKSGLIRRLLPVIPTGNRVTPQVYDRLMAQIKFEYGAIAWHCHEVYEELGPTYYNDYKPVEMMFETDPFFNFVEAVSQTFIDADGTTLKQAWTMYKEYCEDANIDVRMPMYKFREELKSYFKEFYSMTRVNGKLVRSWYAGFKADKLEKESKETPLVIEDSIMDLRHTVSIFDSVCWNCKAQYATEQGYPSAKWADVDTTLDEIDTSKLHYVLLPENHIVIDFDLKDEDGEKNADLNIEAASKWPPTYAEFSKSGAGVHLHYIYDGDPAKLSRIYDTGIEIKVFTGNASLRRKLTYCNDLPVNHISSGLPLKEVNSKMVDFDVVLSEKKIRELVSRNLRKEIHPGTKPSIDFIYTILEEQYERGAKYDIRDMAQDVMCFAMGSTNHAEYCLNMVNKMHFHSDEPSEGDEEEPNGDILTFFDIEVFPNLMLVNWKYEGPEHEVVRMINPTPLDVENLMKHKLVGFNNLRYDNHILYARYLGYNNKQIYELSKSLINSKDRKPEFAEASNLAYADVYDFASAANKKSLKKWEVELGLHHQELGLPWDEPVAEELWPTVAAYCDNDVISTEAVFNHLAADWSARQMLAALSGLPVWKSTNQHTYRILFGKERHPGLIYTDLATGKQYGPGEETPYTEFGRKEGFPLDVVEPKEGEVINAFPGYEYIDGHNFFRGEDIGRGGYVYAVPGIYYNVVCFDSASHHPSSIIAMNYLGDYTDRFRDILQVRLAIKHKDYDTARQMMGGVLAPYLDDESQAKGVANALKTVINSLYGTSAARFDNPARDPRNVNNIVALRGALFMITLRDELLERGATVVHIKTDSIKVVAPTDEIHDFIMDFGKKYGYTFEIEHTFERICLVNDAVYIGKLSKDDPEYDESTHGWTATGAQFMHPYVFKFLFSQEPIEFKDLTEIKSVQAAAIYLDMNETLPEGAHDYHFVGRTGLFVPIRPGKGGGQLVSKRGEKFGAVTGTKGYRWMEAEECLALGKQKDVDFDYYRRLVADATSAVGAFGDIYTFTGWDYADDPLDDENVPPWCSFGIPSCEECKCNKTCVYSPYWFSGN